VQYRGGALSLGLLLLAALSRTFLLGAGMLLGGGLLFGGLSLFLRGRLLTTHVAMNLGVKGELFNSLAFIPLL
jgi:hypothetical protein